MIEVDKATFDEEVLQAPGLVLVDFWSPKCEPCMELMPEVSALGVKYQDKVKFCKLDTASNRRLSISQKVLGLPTIVFYNQGVKVAELTKDFTIGEIEDKLNELLND